MRINVYGEELTFANEVVHKVVDGRNFYGVRMFLESSPFLHATSKDDDRSAVTFWVPWTSGQGNDFSKLSQILFSAAHQAAELISSGEKR